ncbi:XdhC family protein [Pseudarthrobacter sp. P1]|uniref:XdhC family protein n=1 Tax=Pseudarthrobacter sp. P1 TaxID=3418418 RepID=UPI003CEBDA3F
MHNLLESLPAWRATAEAAGSCAVATIVATEGSTPRPVGTSMLVSANGDVLGSLSGGCVEGAVVEAALDSLADGRTRREYFGYSAEDAFAVGLTCGGGLDVHIQPYGHDAMARLFQAAGRAAELAAAGNGVALVRRLSDGGARPGAAAGLLAVPNPLAVKTGDLAGGLAGLLGSGPGTGAGTGTGTGTGTGRDMGQRAAVHVQAMVRAGLTGVVTVAPETPEHDGASPALLVESLLPAPRLLVFGANDFGAELLPGAQLLGYHVTICDARPVFAGQTRFLGAEEVAVEWPDRYLQREALAGRIDGRTVVCILSHDPKFDVPLLATALDLDLAYVGAMGSRRSHQHRVEALLAAGMDPGSLERLHSPIGLDLGAVSPAEVAVSILAEIVAARRLPAHRKSLRNGVGAIHPAALALA